MDKLVIGGLEEWSFDKIQRTYDTLDQINNECFKLDIYPNQLEIITAEQMIDAYTTGAMPIMYPHWSFGGDFLRHWTHYKRGISGLAYEVVINTNPCIAYLMEENTMLTQALVTAHACVSGDTEYLSPTGWKRIDAYDGGMVAQYHKDNTVSFVQPSKHIKRPQESFIHVKGTNIEQKITDDHRVVFVNGNNSLVEITGAELDARQNDKTRGFNGRFITGFKAVTTTSLPFSNDEIRLQVAIKADGSYGKKIDSGHFNCVNHHRVRFHLKKPRKIERLTGILESLGIEYTKKPTYDGRYSITFKYSHRIPKRYDSSWYAASPQQLRLIGEEVLFWDGSLLSSNPTFCSAYKEDVDYIQYVWASLGKSAVICRVTRAWRVSFSENLYRSIGTNRGSEKFSRIASEDGYAYCFTVPSGMFVTRMDDKISVTGNCFGHNTFYKTNYLMKQWTDPSSIVDYLIFAKKYILECEEKYGRMHVEFILDAAHSLQMYGIDRYKRPQKKTKIEKEEERKSREEYRQSKVNELWSTIPKLALEKGDGSKDRPKLPEEPEENILYFIEKNAPRLQAWEREIIRIVRKISQYFYPNMCTSLANEGCATFWHYEFMTEMERRGHLNEGAMLEFLSLHTAVAHQRPDSYGFNVYALGYDIFKNIKRVALEPTAEEREWFRGHDWVGGGDWVAAVKYAVANYKSDSFIQQYLCPETMRKFGMWVVNDNEQNDYYEVMAIQDERGYRKIREDLSKKYNLSFIAPAIEVAEVDIWDTRTMFLRHHVMDGRALEKHTAMETLAYCSSLWGYPVALESVDVTEKVVATYPDEDDVLPGEQPMGILILPGK